MTATVESPAEGRVDRPVTQLRVIASEWLKFRTCARR